MVILFTPEYVWALQTEKITTILLFCKTLNSDSKKSLCKRFQEGRIGVGIQQPFEIAWIET